jgi:hypothetical protein
MSITPTSLFVSIYKGSTWHHHGRQNVPMLENIFMHTIMLFICVCAKFNMYMHGGTSMVYATVIYVCNVYFCKVYESVMITYCKPHVIVFMCVNN